jgi:hypothetical protein
MLPRQNVSKRGQRRRGETRRFRLPAVGIERLEARTLLSGGVIITVAGNGTFGSSGNGVPATEAELDDPTGVALDAAGDLFIADSDNNEIREVVKASGDIITVAGDGTLGYTGDGGPATEADRAQPWDVVPDAAGDLYIADSGNNVIREVVPAPVATKTAVFSSANPSNVGETVTFTATVAPQTGTGTPPGEVTFTIDGTPEPPVQLQVVDGVAQASFPISTLAAGTHSVSAVYDGSPAFAPSPGALPTQTVNPVSAPPPTVVLLQRYGYHEQPTLFVVTFSAALDTASAQNVQNYELFNPSGQRDPVTEAIYNPGDDTVTLLPRFKLNVHFRDELIINGSAPYGVSGTSGQFLDGANDGQAGTDYVRTFIGLEILAGSNYPWQERARLVTQEIVPKGPLHLKTATSAR